MFDKICNYNLWFRNCLTPLTMIIFKKSSGLDIFDLLVMFWGCRWQGCITRLLACLPPIKAEQEHPVTAVLTAWRDLLTLTLCETSRGAFLLSLKAPKSLVIQQFSRWRWLNVCLDCNCAQNCEKKERVWKRKCPTEALLHWVMRDHPAAALSPQIAAAFWNPPHPRHFPDVWWDARIFLRRGNVKNCENGPSRCFRPSPFLAFKARFPVEINPAWIIVISAKVEK